MTASDERAGGRAARRRLQTRAALIGAAQALMAEGREDVAPIAEITTRADVGLGSFYNHFASREELRAAAMDDALEKLGAFLDALVDGTQDPVGVFTMSFRLVGRLFRREPQLCRLLLRGGTDMIQADLGLAPRARRDIVAAVEAGRFSVPEPGTAVAMAAGALIGLGTLLLDDPELDEAQAVDWTVERLLVAFGLDVRAARRLSRADLPELGAVLPATPKR